MSGATSTSSDERDREAAAGEASASGAATARAPGEDGAKTAEDEPETAAKPEPGRMQKLVLEYGAIGIIVLLSLSALTWLGFAAAFMVGFQVEGAAETAGVVAAASAGWLLTKPIRIPLALVLTPVVAALWHRVRGSEATRGD